MKFLKRVLAFTFFIGLSHTGSSQADLAIEKGNLLLNPSITLGWYNYGYGYDLVNIIPPVAFNFEYATHNYLSFGVEAEYAVRNYKEFDFVTGGYQYKYEYKGIAVRGSFHYLDFLKNLLEDKLGQFNSYKLDFYVGASTGVLIVNSTQKWGGVNGEQGHELKQFDSAFQFGYFAGFRYYFSDRFGTFLESGKNSLGWAKVGLTLKI